MRLWRGLWLWLRLQSQLLLFLSAPPPLSAFLLSTPLSLLSSPIHFLDYQVRILQLSFWLRRRLQTLCSKGLVPCRGRSLSSNMRRNNGKLIPRLKFGLRPLLRRHQLTSSQRREPTARTIVPLTNESPRIVSFACTRGAWKTKVGALMDRIGSGKPTLMGPLMGIPMCRFKSYRP
jgi:hypothetical protein